MVDLSYMKTKLYYAWLSILCVTKSIMGTRRAGDVRTIAVVQLAWLGDMVCTTPLFSAIKKHIPQSRLIVVGAKRNKDLLHGHPDVDRYVSWQDDISMMKKELSTESIDAVCLATPHFLSLALFCLLKVPQIIIPIIRGGFSPYETISYKILSSFVGTKVVHTMGTYAPREYLRLLEPLGIHTEDTKKKLVYTDESANRIQKLFSEHGVGQADLKIGISPSTANKIKMWPAERFGDLADYIIKKCNARIFVFGSDSDRSDIETMCKKIQDTSKVIDLGGALSLEELKACIDKMDMFISVDTGPIYIAEAFEVPTVDIVGPMDEREQPPQGKIHKIVVSPYRKEPIIHIMNARVYDKELARKSVHDISVDMVKEAVDSLYTVIV